MKRLLLCLLLVGCSPPSGNDDDDNNDDDNNPQYTIVNKYGRDFINYANVTKTNDVPKLWIRADTVQFVGTSGDMGDGVMIMREEGDPVVGWIFIRERVGGSWASGNFYPDAIDFTTVDDSTPAPENLSSQCLSCHPTQVDTTFTLPSLRRFLETGQVEALSCDQPGNTPCAASTYQ